MKKFMILLCTLLVLTVCTGAWAEETDKKIYIPGEDLVLIEQDGVRIILNDEQPGEYIDEGDFEYVVFVENNTGTAVDILYNAKVNGLNMGSDINWLYLGMVPASYEKMGAGLRIERSMFYDFNEGVNIDDIHAIKAYADVESLEINFRVQCAGASFETGSGVIFFDADSAESYETVQEEQDSEEQTEEMQNSEKKVFLKGQELVLLDQNGVKLTLTGESDAEGQLIARLENNSDKEVWIDHCMVNNVTDDLIRLYTFSYENPQYESSGVKPGEDYEYAIAHADRCYTAGEVVCDIMVKMLEEGNVVDGFNTRETIFFEKEYETLEIGSKGDAVVALQKKLADVGVSIGSADGVYGKGTAEAVKVFQRNMGMEETGIADPETQKALFAR